jgi:hypothetical protein
MFNFLKCKHPLDNLMVEKKETRTSMDDEFNKVTYHFVCSKCGKPVKTEYAELKDEGPFLSKGMANDYSNSEL